MQDNATHPSAFALEAFSVASPTRQSAEVAVHVQACARCRECLEALAAQRQAMLAAKPALLFAEEVCARARVGSRTVRLARMRGQLLEAAQWLGQVVRGDRVASRRRPLLVALAAATLIVLAAPAAWWQRDRTVERVEALRPMGGFSAQVLRKRNDRVEPVAGEVGVRAGDAVRCKVIAPVGGFVALFFVSDQGKVTWISPATASGAAVAVAAGESLLEATAYFDGEESTETLFIAYGHHRFAPGAVANGVAEGLGKGGLPDFRSEGVELWSVRFSPETR